MRVRKQSGAEWRAIYTQFLASPAWDAKRALVMGRAGGTCEACLNKPAYHVHHVVYPQPLTHDTLTHQPAWQLRAVCATCHAFIHQDHP